MEAPQEQFDDPALREAIRRSVGKPAAPARLRSNISALMLAEAVATGPKVKDARPRWRSIQLTPRLALAAVLAVLAIGFAFYQLNDFYQDVFHRGGPVAASTLPDKISTALVSSHDALNKQSTTAPAVDYMSLRTKLSKEAGFAAFVEPIGDGWNLQGGQVTQIEGRKAAQVLFTRNGAAASIFTFPYGDIGGCGGSQVCQQINHHALAAVTHGGLMYAVEVTGGGSSDAETILANVSKSVLNAPAPATTTSH